MSSTQVGRIILLQIQRERSVLEMVNWTNVRKTSGHLPVSLSRLGDGNNTPLLLPTSFLEAQTEPTRSASFHSSYSSFCNSMCFGSVRRGSFHVANSALRRLHWVHTIVRTSGSWMFFWIKECLKPSLRLLRRFGFAWMTLNPLSRQVLHNQYRFFDANWILPLRWEPFGLLLSHRQHFRQL